ncbi:hypothetical protein EI427_00555 [Flammeovirga pectinis]|uniref:DUF4168 domain-containing protein n=1 Tax=Flammeovirga pectinis TaxID=2494373 RepID=A0A3Q9FL71_9BACT|nr:hypothetical protein [Flammeovirga pectinis]AZQ60751.1 hypothetical protein EI427_00555 [Flammeovirga pectinis]
MKKYFIILFAVLTTLTAFGQQKKNGKQKKSAFFATEFAQEFSLSKEVETKVYEIKLSQMDEAQVVFKAKKSNEITPEEAKAQLKVINKKYSKMILIESKVNQKEYYAFVKELQPKMKEVK